MPSSRSVIVLLLSAPFLIGCGIVCNDETIREFESPDRKYLARVVLRGCGATTPFFTQVHLRKQYWPGFSDIVVHVEGRQTIGVRWQQSTALDVICKTCGQQSIEASATWKGVRISVVVPK